MKWNLLYPIERKPTMEEIREYIAPATPFWDALISWIDENYGVPERMDYSRDSLQPGWNVKFRKSGKALCALYPMPGWFYALIVVGAKEEAAVRKGLEEGQYSPYIKELFDRTSGSKLGRWLMIEVREPSVLQDIQQLIMIRVKPNSERRRPAATM